MLRWYADLSLLSLSRLFPDALLAPLLRCHAAVLVTMRRTHNAGPAVVGVRLAADATDIFAGVRDNFSIAEAGAGDDFDHSSIRSG